MPQQDDSFLKAALIGYEQELHRVEQAMANIRARLAGKTSAQIAPPSKRKISKEASNRIAAAQKKRWEEYRRQKAAQQ